jgi:hypothetical protein
MPGRRSGAPRPRRKGAARSGRRSGRSAGVWIAFVAAPARERRVLGAAAPRDRGHSRHDAIRARLAADGRRLWPGGRLIVPVLPLAATLADALGAARRDGKPPEVPAPPEARGFS